MNALQSYSSDNESDEEPVIKRMNKIADSGTNYDDVGMDISEESGDDAADADGIPKNERGTNGTNNARSNSYVKNKAIPSSAESDEKKPHLSESTKDQDLKSSDVECSTGRNKRSEEKQKIDHRTSSRKKRSRSKDRNNRSRSREKNRSKSKERTIRSRSQDKSDRSGSKERSNRSRSRERGNRDVERGTKDRKDSRDQRESRRSSDARDSRDYRRRGGRRSRSRSRERRRSRSRSRSRDRDRRKRRTRTRTRSRSRSRSRDRKRPHEIRREAQQKLAAFKASNPNFDHNEMLKRGMEAQFAEVQKNTGVTLPTYYNPAIMNPLKIAEQERKKKLLWGNKNKPVEATVAAEPVGGSGSEKLWVNTKFSNDSDGKMAEKFKRLMGVKAAGSTTSSYAPESHPEGSKDSSEILEKQETLFNSMEKQYEVARLATHTQRGFGLGFSSQSYLPK